VLWPNFRPETARVAVQAPPRESWAEEESPPEDFPGPQVGCGPGPRQDWDCWDLLLPLPFPFPLEEEKVKEDDEVLGGSWDFLPHC
jgi:hypothetical protein